ncbi:MAG: GNAT family N-acetyltransferase [Saccharofermentanales bacterium]
MDVDLKQLNYLEYAAGFRPILGSALLDYYVRLATPVDYVLGFYDEGKPVGSAMLLQRYCPPGCLELTYFCVAPTLSARGYGRAVVEKTIAFANDQGIRELTCRLMKSTRFFDAALHIIEDAGFQYVEDARIFRCEIDDPTRENWQYSVSMYFEKLRDRLNRLGLSCVSFAHADDRLLQRVTDDSNNGFDDRYPIAPLVSGVHGCFLSDYSFIAHRDGIPAAVTIVLRADSESLVFQLISEADAFKSSGSLILPVMCSLEQAISSQYKRVSYCVFSSNKASLKVMKDLFGKLTAHETIMFCYRLAID